MKATQLPPLPHPDNPALTEYQFKADLIFELPTTLDPQTFFTQLITTMTTHTEAHQGHMGGSTHWQHFKSDPSLHSE
jgi:hypothetical protein